MNALFSPPTRPDLPACTDPFDTDVLAELSFVRVQDAAAPYSSSPLSKPPSSISYGGDPLLWGFLPPRRTYDFI